MKTKKHFELFTELKPMLLSLKKLKNDPFEKNAINQFDVLSWIESKIKNKSFIEIKTESPVVNE